MTQQKSSDVIYVDITSAAALTGREKQTICRLLSQALNVKNIVLKEKTDESLIGGFQIQMASCCQNQQNQMSAIHHQSFYNRNNHSVFHRLRTLCQSVQCQSFQTLTQPTHQNFH